jgi:hypothetical protein
MGYFRKSHPRKAEAKPSPGEAERILGDYYSQPREKEKRKYEEQE